MAWRHIRGEAVSKLRLHVDWQPSMLSSCQQKSLKTASESKSDLSKAFDEAKTKASQVLKDAKLTAEQVRRSVNESAQQAFQSSANPSNQSPQGATEGAQADPQSRDSSGSEQSSAGSGFKAEKASSGGSDNSESRQQSGASSSQTSSAPSLGQRLRNAFAVARKEISDAVMPRQETVSATKARDPSIKPAGDPTSTGITIVKQPDSKWRKQWADMQDKLGKHPFFAKLQYLSDNAAVNKGRDIADNIRERWETSDSRLVQRIQDMRDNLMTESEPAQALREIRSRYPDFDMVHFVRMLKVDVPVVIKAYLEGNLDVLREHSAPDMMERFTGIINAQNAEGSMPDPTILYTSDVELVDIKFLENNPVVVVQFNCQQINCRRDKFGNVVEGSPNDVQRHYYYWALQQDDAGFVGEDGKFHPPRWQLKEMLVRGQHNLL